MKKLFLFALLCSVTCIKSWPGQSFWNLLKQSFKYNNNNYVDYDRAKRITLQEWERIFKPGLQIGIIKNEVANFGNKIAHEITQSLKSMTSLSQGSLHYEAKRMVHYYALRYIDAKTQDLCWKKLNHTPINPELLDKTNIVQTITINIVKEAEDILNHNQTLDNFLKDLEIIINNELELIYQSYLTSDSSEIVEVYPQTQSSLDEYHVKFERVKQYREDSCCICMEDFGGNIKRVNLLCGHTACPNCLYSWMYQSGQYNAKTCPICRASVKTEDYPSRFLENHFH